MPKNLFQCDICGRIHTTKGQATDCEKYHVKVGNIVESVFVYEGDRGKYPEKILVEMSDKRKLWFFREGL
jgi:hypothetical protein